MRAISLFSGAGGFELGFEAAGIETVLQAESDPWCQGVLARRWPATERVADVRSVPAQPIDLVFGGWPCIGHSGAGARRGFDDERSGLWREFERVIRECRPAWVVAENVTGLLSQPEFGAVISSLDRLGYVGAWRVVSSLGFGLPQTRRRVVIVAAAGAGRGDPSQVLLEPEGRVGIPATRGTTGTDPSIGPHGRATAAREREECERCGDWVCVACGLHFTTDCTCLGIERMCPECEEWWEDEEQGFCPSCLWEPYQPWLPVHVGTLSDGAHLGGGSNGQDILSGRIIVEYTGPRRLSPIECERLMGWPDDHTCQALRDGRLVPVPASHRYRMTANGVAAPLAEWLGRRLMEAEARAG